MTYVAEKGTIFYRNNGNSNLENIKEARLYDVALWASEQKDYDEIINAHYEAMSKTT